jgi:hypothetical protein
VDAGEANELLRVEGHAALRLVDNGEIGPDTHTFHLSREDLAVAEVVGRLFLVANAVAGDSTAFPNVERTEAAMSEGFYEAIIRSLAESS